MSKKRQVTVTREDSFELSLSYLEIGDSEVGSKGLTDFGPFRTVECQNPSVGQIKSN